MPNQVDLTAILKKIPWFLDLSPTSLTRLANLAKISNFQINQIIFQEGEQDPHLYVILEGKVLLESYVPGHGPLPYCTVESLDVIGCSSLTPVVRQKTSTARVLDRTTLLTFPAERLMALCDADCELGYIIMRRLANIVASRMLNHRLQLLRLLTAQKP